MAKNKVAPFFRTWCTFFSVFVDFVSCDVTRNCRFVMKKIISCFLLPFVYVKEF